MSTGTPSPHVCKRSTKCERCKETISLDESCFRIPKQSAGFTKKPIHCISCTRKIVTQTRKDLEKVEKLVKAS